MNQKELHNRVKHYHAMAAEFRLHGFIEDANDLEKHINAIMGPVERVGLAGKNAGNTGRWRNKTKRQRATKQKER